jgi:hypothetical protein
MPVVVVTNSDVVDASPLTAAVDRKHNVLTTTKSNIMLDENTMSEE